MAGLLNCQLLLSTTAFMMANNSDNSASQQATTVEQFEYGFTQHGKPTVIHEGLQTLDV